MAAKWQFLFSMLLIFTLVFPDAALAAARKHQVSQKKTVHTLAKKTAGASAKKAAPGSAKKSTQASAKKTASASAKKTAYKKGTAATTGRRVARKKVKTARSKKVLHKPKIASRMMWTAPLNTKPLNAKLSSRMKANFQRGMAGRYTPEDLVRARVFTHTPLRGGIRPRNAQVQNLIIHSTETARVADAKTVVQSWNNGGLSHPGTQYIVDRDGKIHQTVDPKYATIHVNEKRTLRGITNDNSIGIEIVRAEKQKYTTVQLAALVRLVDYIQERFPISKIYGHGQIQPSNRSDPVAFDWSLFNRNLALINSSSTQTAYSSEIDDDPQG